MSALFRAAGNDVSKPTFKANDFMPRIAATLPSASSQGESAGDRVLLTLLALGLMLLAFFVVLTSFGSFDARRMRGVAESMQSTFDHAAASDVVDVRLSTETDRAAVNALRASVADIFANVVAGDAAALTSADATQTRVDIDVPLALFFPGEGAELSSLPLLDKIIAVISAPPAGYRMELAARARVAQADMPLAQTRVAAFANTLVARGTAPTALAVGTLRDTSAAPTPTLRFSFLLLGSDDDIAATRLVAAP